MDTPMEMHMDLDVDERDFELDPDAELDLDIDIGLDDDFSVFEAPNATQTNGTSVNAISSDPTIADPAPAKVHIRGLDELTTTDIKDYVAQYYPSDDFVRIEWIDDTSANVVYETPEAALGALSALSDLNAADVQTVNVLQPRKARPIPSHPDTALEVRQAFVTDIKKPRAHEASRFYLFNPEHDPRERQNRRGQGGRNTGDRGDYKRRRFDDRENARRLEGSGFNASMYDDDADVEQDNRDTRHGQRRRGHRAGRGRKEELFTDRNAHGRLRGRSASPLRESEDGRLGFKEERTRQRSDTPPRRRPADLTTRNAGKELFPDHGASTARRSPAIGVKELFPHLLPAAESPRRPRELFPHRTDKSNHRRSDALDADEQLELANRISGHSSNRRQLRSDEQTNGGADEADEGFSIRGHAQNSGFAIKGAAKEFVKELFPLKTGNAGKELFADKMKGRGAQRRKAEDMYF
ncbi:MAG: hypothetical protein M1820_004839 [Bogoriella megaspora]|nr:MAG: hypothetical protein M1820_004839 [Bogoriella megaspora]